MTLSLYINLSRSVCFIIRKNFSAKLTLLHMSVNNLDRKRIVFQIIETIHGNVGIFQIEVLNVHLFLPSLFIECLCSRNQEQRLRQT